MCSARKARRLARSASTASTSAKSARGCAPGPVALEQRYAPSRMRAVRSSANSQRTAASVTTAAAISRSTCPRTSAAFHPERRAASRDRTSRAARRGRAPTGAASPRRADRAGLGIRVVQSSHPPVASGRLRRADDLVGAASAQALASQARRSADPARDRVGGAPLGLVSVDVAGDLRGRALNGPTNAASCTTRRSGSRVKPRAASAALNSGSVITAACPMPLIASRESRTRPCAAPANALRRTPAR